MNKRQKIMAFVVISAFVIPSLFVIVAGAESFPYTNCPMFAHYIGKDTYFYDFTFVSEDGQAIQPKCEKASELHTKRLFFNKIYGSAEADSPFGHYKDDSSAEFEERMNLFFKGYFKHVPLEHPQADTIHFEIRQYNRNYTLTSTHRIGYYNVESKKFKHTWPSQL